MLNVRCFLGMCLLICSWASIADAQLFGPRALGGPFESRRGAAAASADDSGAGTLQGNERFLRDNRSRGAFVGSNRGSLQGFVGNSQAIGVGRVPAATESLTPPPDRSATVNRPLPSLPANAMYYPRLVVEFGGSSGSANAIGGQLVERDRVLQERLSKIAGSPISVRRRDNGIVLQGTVTSRALAEKLAIMASFEPHVDAIENRLVHDSHD